LKEKGKDPIEIIGILDKMSTFLNPGSPLFISWKVGYYS